ncbi:alpha-L-rhamnosidase [Mucilaginibacter pineti]|uniref:Alpha-L-rhamnosidase n=1 Tax=Mucilaginibacter pineti TaxID=1391627 RepID=A0A1G6SUV4_9SPHI|nr:glycosyl hydrolase [Mucilaginibacter pineti]SDD19905.1 alpha-L-rhamnosidase [Mucilaginibacter pineti]
MRNIYKSACIVTLAFTCIGSSTMAQQKVKPVVSNSLYSGFKTTPDSVQTSVYWYWLSGNVSKEGVIKDLESMKKVGINRAFIGNIGLDDVPYGKVKLFSDEWWDIMHTALKTATRLGIDIGIFNSPGWSQSGGPWVKPEQAMRYLTSSTQTVKGPIVFNQKLTSPVKQFQDVKVIAYPAPTGFGTDISSGNKVTINSEPSLTNVNNLIDGNESTTASLPSDKKTTVTITADGAKYTARSVMFYLGHRALRFEGDIQALDNDGHTYKTIKHFIVDRSNSALNVGFSPYAPGAVSIPATTSSSFRIVFDERSYDAEIAEIKISAQPLVENYAEKTLAKMFQTPLPYWKEYQWVPQPPVDDKNYVIDPAKVIDISKYLAADGTLKWNVPAGNWVIERTGMTPTQVTNSPAPPEGTGLEVDKMSKQHIAEHFDAFLGQILKRIPAADRKSFKVAVQDSYETGGQNWTDALATKFQSLYGYDPTPYMPVVNGRVAGSQDQSDRFLWDLRRFVADEVAYQYVGGLRDVSHKNGLTTWLENYGHWGFPGEFLQYGGQSDEIGGEFWSEGELGNIENRAASSCAHIYGKNKVSAESFTCGGGAFSRYPAMMKQRGDRFFTEGINNTLLHVYIEQPYEDKVPGVNTGFSNEFNRLNTWFYDMDLFTAYIKRCNFMLRQGSYVADVAYFIGEDAPKMTGVRDPELPQGYSFDYINAEILNSRAKVVNGKLVLASGMSYKILVLPKLETMRPLLLRNIKKLVSEGLTILGPAPSRSPSLQNYGSADAEIKSLASELWGDIDGSAVKTHKYGQGLVINGMDMEQALKLVNVPPDCRFDKDKQALFIHRRLADGDVYFVSNQTDKDLDLDAAFRVSGKAPELWDPVTGSSRNLPSYKQEGAITTVPLKLAPNQSSFVVFRKNSVAGKAKDEALNYPKQQVVNKINTPWKVTFDTKRWGPTKPVFFDKLDDWTKRAEDSIKYYSGSAVYHNTFNIAKIEKGKHLILDLGQVKAMAKVKINGVEVGGVWTAPYVLDITGKLKPGNNTIDVTVVNTWVNRLIGDSKLPADKRNTWTINNPYNEHSNLEASGLTGPVSIKSVAY